MPPRDINRTIERIKRKTTQERSKSPAIIQQTSAAKGGGGGGARINVYAVSSLGTGTGVYNCTKQKIDGSLWGSPRTGNLYTDVDETSFEVFNLRELSWEILTWEVGVVYQPRREVVLDETFYTCIRYNIGNAHATTGNKPGVSTNWTDFWREITTDKHMLAAGQRIVAWTENDDEGEARLVGFDIHAADIQDVIGGIFAECD